MCALVCFVHMRIKVHRSRLADDVWDLVLVFHLVEPGSPISGAVHSTAGSLAGGASGRFSYLHPHLVLEILESRMCDIQFCFVFFFFNMDFVD